MRELIEVSAEVQAALATERPVVALETTLVTHGLPQPEGVLTAAALEREVRATGAVPATIAVFDGYLRVGLSSDELDRLAASRASKLNLSNLAAGLASGQAGSTTVAATLFAAHRVGIRVFATGGIGGVHLGDAGDVSADLTALSRYPLAVVCAGAKAVLDLPRTIEMLETLGVPVLGYGTDRFPAFYRRDSGLPVDRACDSVAELGRVVRAHLELGLGGGIVVANPVPAEHELPLEEYETALRAALAKAERSGVRGREVTPFLLETMRQLTEGDSVFSNRALLVNNARVAAELAAELAS